MSFTSGLILIYLFGSSCHAVPDWDQVERSTSYGAVRGYRLDLQFRNISDMTLEVFLGIPYATPPVGNRRWTRPEEPSPWHNKTCNASDFGPCCMQRISTLQRNTFGPHYNNTSEDCLFLNIYSPRNTSIDDNSERNAVMVWIHGGANRYGSGEEYDGRILAEQGVVVVTINYRLGVIGYLSTDDSVSPGNYALLDQVLALKWVKRNIHNFGGDPDRITIFGHSAGGSHVGLHLFSPLTKGLFQGCIPQSGSPLSPWSIYRPPLTMRSKTEEIARHFGCPTGDSYQMLQCLRGKDAVDLVEKRMSGNGFNGAFVPRIDNHYIQDTPENLLATGSFHADVALMTGTVPDEVSDEFPHITNISEGWNRKEKLRRMRNWSQKFGQASAYAYEAVTHEYDYPGDNWNKSRDLFIEMRSDYEYVAPHDAHTAGHSRNQSDTFLYSFEHRMENHPKPEWMGVPHFEEIYYIFGCPFWDDYECPWPCRNVNWTRTYTEEDRQLSIAMMQMWANFAKTRKPSTDIKPHADATWEPFNTTTQSYLRFVTPSLQTDTHYKYRRVNFWNRYFTGLLDRLDKDKTVCPTTKIPPPPSSQTVTVTASIKLLTSTFVSIMALLYSNYL